MRRLAAAMALAVVMAVAACGGGEARTQAEQTSITLMLNWTPNTHHLGVYTAEQRGWYDEAGLDVTIIEPASGGVAAAVAAGQADLGISVAEEVLPARASGVPVVSVATILPRNDSSLMALADEGITRPRDLEGKTYGGYEGALETELISRLVSCDGGDPAAVEMVNIGDADYLAGLELDRYDVVWVFSGWDALRAEVVAQRPVSQIRFADQTECIPNWYTPLFVASEATVAERPEVVRSFLAATARGYDAAIADPAAGAADFLAAVPEADEALVRASADYYAPRFADPGIPWGHQDPAVWRDFAAFADEAGLLSAPVDPATAYTDDLLPSP